MERNVELVKKTKFSQMEDVFVMKDFTKYLVNVGLAILVHLIMVLIVFAIMDIMGIEIFAKSAIVLVELAQVLMQVNV